MAIDDHDSDSEPEKSPLEKAISAVRAGDIAAVEAFLASSDAHVDSHLLQDNDANCPKWSLLLHATDKNRPEMMRALLRRGADPNLLLIAYGLDGYRPLHHAALFGLVEAAAVLLEAGARTEDRTAVGATPLLVAAAKGHVDILKLLLEHGALERARDNNGYDAYNRARHKRTGVPAIQFLVDVTEAGGWRGYVREPRVRLFELRTLCALGLASAPRSYLRFTDVAPAKLLERVFGPNRRRGGAKPPPDSAAAAAPPKIPRDDARVRHPLPKEVFWLILEFWHAERDAPFLPRSVRVSQT